MELSVTIFMMMMAMMMMMVVLIVTILVGAGGKVEGVRLFSNHVERRFSS